VTSSLPPERHRLDASHHPTPFSAQETIREKFRKLIKRLYNKLPFSYERELDRAVGDCKTLVDFGCGYPSPIRGFSSRLFAVGVDLFEPDIDKSRIEKIHNEYRLLDAIKTGEHFSANSFECALASDLIEHLTKEDGKKLIEVMERLASRRVIIFTPNGFLLQPAHSGNPWQEHRSGWSVEEMQKLGYRVVGMNGWKPLRKEFAQIRFKPVALWAVISSLSQLLVRSRPKFASQILCIKDLPKGESNQS
jgi:hypothetical protein